MRKLIWSIIYIILATPVFILANSEEKKITVPVDIIATGGAGITSYDKFGMIYMNPAAFAIPENARISILKTGVTLNYDLYNYYSLYNYLANHNNDLSSLSSSQWKTLLNLNANIGLSGPLAVGYIWQGIGFLIYDDFLTSALVKQGPGLPYVDFGSYYDTTFLAGFGFKIPSPEFFGKFISSYAGITVKYINRLKYENPRMSLLETFDTFSGIVNFNKGFLWGQAIGSDVGYMVKGESWTGGFVIRDWFTTQFSWNEYDYKFNQIPTTNIPSTYFYPSFDIGGSYRFNNFAENLNILGPTLYFDLVNIFDFSENYFLKVRFGVELAMFNFLRLRAGIYKGYPTAGFGLVFPFININAAYYTEELGDTPGSIPQQNYVLDFHFIL